MVNRYKELGTTVSLPEFEKYVQFFIDNTKYKPTKFVTYPDISNYGINILSDNVTTVSTIQVPFGTDPINYSMSAILPFGTNLKVVLKDGIWGYRVLPNGPVNWTITQYKNEMQTFTVTESDKTCDLHIQFFNPDTLKIEFYENNSLIPTKTKQLIVK
jgi:hypothetical protein